ncbi:ATP-binding cassette domain-containing protein [Streptomyces sp. NPDC052043]|uniref:ATP-binding cassette domain-containing protein n=1 Tax=Streptomyces sp. NPDC052043 TaxID=3365684 RepID=UPI0037D33F89
MKHPIGARQMGGTSPSAERKVLLQAHGIVKRYKGRRVLNGVDLVVHAGEVAAIVGSNGAGKSTMLKICAGLLSPDKGQVRAGGNLGYCPQNAGVIGFLTPREHFTLFGTGRGLSRREAERRGRRLGTQLDWNIARNVLAKDLSGGTRQKLNVALSALGDPDLLLLDEPYQGFDHGSYVDFWHNVWSWREAGKAVVVVTHMLNQLDRVDQVLDLTPATKRENDR